MSRKNLVIRGLVSLILLLLMTIPAVSDVIAQGIESRFQFALTLF
ncbi:hypothetical protein [Pseudocitrobacter cyperus]|uniref:Uncharacterized protein n=1 Tax=Pseudocitrobacter cyperus TaxID=3112843 RepID=A0ABV0HJ99_9ENTR